MQIIVHNTTFAALITTVIHLPDSRHYLGSAVFHEEFKHSRVDSSYK